MQAAAYRPVSGHVLLVRRKGGDVFFAKGRDAAGRQFKRKIGPRWTGKGRPPAGYFTRRTAEGRLREILADVQRGTLAGTAKTGATFADAAEEWLRHAEHERALKPSTLRDYRSAVQKHLLPAFGDVPLEKVTARSIETWRSRKLANGLSRRNAAKLTAIVHGIFERARKLWHLPANPAADVEKLKVSYSGRFDFYSPEEVWALVRAAGDAQDAAIFLTAAFTGLRRGEVLALRWRDVDFAQETIRVEGSLDSGELGTTKSGRVRSVPMVPEVAAEFARIGQRERFAGPDDFVFAGETGAPLDGSALRRRYIAARGRAELRPLRFHDLRHTFASLVAPYAAGDRELQEWLGHADAKTTRRYTHYRSRGDEARRIASAFRVAEPAEELVR